MIVSWQGSEVGGGWNLRRLRYVLDAAQQAGVRVTVHLETLAANRVGREGATPEPDVLTAWIVELVDTLATHPAWLKVDGRPVIFAYVWDFAGNATWDTVRQRLRAGGRTPLLMADSTNPANLLLADGLSTYSGTLFAPDVRTLMRDTASATRAYHLLGAEWGSPRIAVATVMPGYDETRPARPIRPGRAAPRRRVLRWAVGSGARRAAPTGWSISTLERVGREHPGRGRPALRPVLRLADTLLDRRPEDGAALTDAAATGPARLSRPVRRCIISA